MSSTQMILATGLLFWIITCLAILDIARKDFGTIEKKAGWIILCALVPFVGVLVYLIFGFRKGTSKSGEPAQG